MRKTAGASSTQAGIDVRRRLRRYFAEQGYTEKLALGHFGTLDPLAEGVLPLAVGKATRLFPLIENRSKIYALTLLLGYATASGDEAGEITERLMLPDDAQAKLAAAIPAFVGERTQIPPMTSALKVDGKRLYELAREGVTIERAPRPVTIHALELLGPDLALAPEADCLALRLRVHCSEGTYVRTLCEELAVSIGARGHMRSLLREAAGPFTIETSRTWAEIDADPASVLLDPLQILPFKSLELTGEALVRFRHGQSRLLKDGLLDAAGIEEEEIASQTVFVTTTEHGVASVVGLGILLGKQLVPRSVFA